MQSPEGPMDPEAPGGRSCATAGHLVECRVAQAEGEDLMSNDIILYIYSICVCTYIYIHTCHMIYYSLLPIYIYILLLF